MALAGAAASLSRELSREGVVHVFARSREVVASPSASRLVRSPPAARAMTCTRVEFLRIEGDQAWAEMSPAIRYHGNKLDSSHLEGRIEVQIIMQLEEKDQFALEMDHFADCILQSKEPKSPGEEGLRDHRIMEAIYEAARSGAKGLAR